MNPKRTRRTHTTSRQVKRPRRRLLFASIISVILLLFCSYGVFVYINGTPKFWSETVPVKTALFENVQLAWPAVGQAAVGSVEDGLLARSSEDEVARPTASMAKVITALAIMEKQPLEPGQTGRSYTLTSKDVANYHAEVARGGSVVPVHAGMVLTQYQAMQMMLVASDNNISDMLAERTFGSIEAYKTYAHAMLRRMGLGQTTVADASGFSSATVSTPSELVAIGIAALKNPIIAEIVAQPQAWIPAVGTIKNTNELLGAEGVVGIKTGTTNEAGNCLLFAARSAAGDGQEVTIVGVIMGDTSTASLFNDSRKLLVSAKQGFGITEVDSANDTAAPLPKQEDRVRR